LSAQCAAGGTREKGRVGWDARAGVSPIDATEDVEGEALLAPEDVVGRHDTGLDRVRPLKELQGDAQVAAAFAEASGLVAPLTADTVTNETLDKTEEDNTITARRSNFPDHNPVLRQNVACPGPKVNAEFREHRLLELKTSGRDPTSHIRKKFNGYILAWDRDDRKLQFV
jgi:hypothetical protein